MTNLLLPVLTRPNHNSLPDTIYMAIEDDVTAQVKCVEMSREAGNTPELHEFIKHNIMPRITTGNTAIPCTIISERMGEILA